MEKKASNTFYTFNRTRQRIASPANPLCFLFMCEAPSVVYFVSPLVRIQKTDLHRPTSDDGDRPVIGKLRNLPKENRQIRFYLPLSWKYLYIYIYHTWKKVGIQRRKNVNNDAWMRGKWRPKKGIHMTHYCEVFWGIFLSFLRRYSRFCIVGYRLFSRYDIYIYLNLHFYFLLQNSGLTVQ